MAGLVIDASSPAVVTGIGPTLTTASFTPPANSRLTILHSGNSATNTNAPQPTITDNLGSHLTYTLLDFASRADDGLTNGQATTWTAQITSSAAMTISVTNNTSAGATDSALKVLVWTDTNGMPRVGAHGKGHAGSSTSAIAQNYTAQASGGWGVINVADWDTTGAETAGTGCTLINSATVGGYSYGMVRRTTADDSNGTTNTLNVTIGAASANLQWTYFEILPALAARAPSVVSMYGGSF